jgi:DNA-directed RNA polymerase subunit RPC12/RpoP
MLSGLSEQRVMAATVATCLRCSGLILSESGTDLVVLRCVQCGERVDSVILENRRKALAA